MKKQTIIALSLTVLAALAIGLYAYLRYQQQSSYLMPATGGIGTTIFYCVGGALMVGAIILLVTKKRVNGSR